METQAERLKKPLNERYIGVTFEGSTFPDAPYKTVEVTLGNYIIKEYLPALEKAIPNAIKGMKLLCTIFANKEGFYPVKNKAGKITGTRAYVNNNPGNIGNTDSGANQKFETLEAGILAQKFYFEDVAAGKHKAYPMGVLREIKPFYSKEIANNPGYGLPANLPGYRFVFSGQLDQFIKIYSTGARAGNNYLNQIVSYFAQNGIKITPEIRIQDIILMN